MARPRAMDSGRKQTALRLAARGVSINRIARQLGVAAITIRRELKRDARFATLFALAKQNSAAYVDQGAVSPMRTLAGLLRSEFEEHR